MGILIKADGQVSNIDDITYEGLKKAVNGWLEVVSFPFAECRGLVGYIDEEGKLKQKPVNYKATYLWEKAYGQRLSDFLVGDVVICGSKNGEEKPLSLKQKAFLFGELDAISDI